MVRASGLFFAIMVGVAILSVASTTNAAETPPSIGGAAIGPEFISNEGADTGPSTANSKEEGPSLLNPECISLLRNLLPGTADARIDPKYTNQQVCDAYKQLLTRYRPFTDGCSPKKDQNGISIGITKLNSTFAVNLNNFLNDATLKGISISSAYRDTDCERINNPGGFNGNYNLSKHTQGLAADLSYPDTPNNSKYTCDGGAIGSPNYQAVERLSRANSFGVRLYNQNAHSSYVKGECNHLEDSTGVKGGPAPGGPTGTPVADNSNEARCARQYASNTADFANCVRAYQRIDAQLNNPNYSANYGNPIPGKCYRSPVGIPQELACASANSGGLLGSLFGGGNQTIPCYRYVSGTTYIPTRCTMSSSGSNSLFGGNSEMGKLMQLMGGMQIGQGLGGSLFGGSGTSQPTAPPPPSYYYNPPIPPPIPPQPPITPTPPGTSAIDKLIATLGNTPATTPTPSNTGVVVAVSPTSVGQLEKSPGNSASGVVIISTLSTSSLENEVSVLRGQLNAATSAIAQASSTGSISAITGALNSIGSALSAIGHFFANIFTPTATTTR